MSILSGVIPPSKNLEHYLKNYLKEKSQSKDEQIQTIAKYSLKCTTKLCVVGPKGRTLTVPEIERAWVRDFKMCK